MTTVSHLAVRRTPGTGGDSSPSVVLLHGFASRGDHDFPADRWIEPLSAAGREAIVVDLPGHGDSPALPAGPFTTSQVLAALAAVVAAAEGTEVDVVGYSLGARLAWDLVAASPKPVRRLVLGGLSPQEPFGALDAAAAEAFFAGGPAPADPLTAMLSGMMAAPGQDSDSLLSLVTGMATEPFDPAATPPQVPTLFLAGEDDPMTRGLDDVARHVPGSRVVRVPGDHVGALQGEELRDAALSFLGVRG